MSYRHSSYRKVRRALAKCQDPHRCDEHGMRLLSVVDALRVTPAEMDRLEIAWAEVPRELRAP